MDIDESMLETTAAEGVAETTAPAEVVEQPQTGQEPVVEGGDQPTEPQATLYELPDGRQVDGETLAKEWKENFLPDYTRKSQILTDIARVNGQQGQDQAQQSGNQNINNSPNSQWQNPNWVPRTYAEIVEVARQEALSTVERQQAEAMAQRAQIDKVIDNTITELKKTDPNLNPDLLFQHASKYGITDLKVAHQNMLDMKGIAKQTEKRVTQNLNQRASEPIAVQNGNAPANAGVDYNTISQGNMSPQEYLESLQGK